MTLDIKKFIQEEGLSLKRFDEWLKIHPDAEPPNDPNLGRSVKAKDPQVLRKFLEALRGKGTVDKIMKEMEEGKLVIEAVGNYFLTVKYSGGVLHIPKPMVE